MFADAMDIFSLINWRLTCKTNYHQATSSFRRSLLTRLQRFVPYPHTLVDIVNKHHAIFGGEFALSFLLRDEGYVAASLEIFASDYNFDALCGAILQDAHILHRVDQHSYVAHSLFDSLRRLISQTLHIKMSNGASIYLHQSYTCSPAAPITCSTCTALSNFVTGYGFGCSHPRLTLDRRALLADQEVQFMSRFDELVLDELRARHFSTEVSPTAWPEYCLPPIPLPTANPAPCSYPTLQEPTDDDADTDTDVASISEECWRHKYVCPTQGRFFGDRGSFVDYFDPLAGDKNRCIENNIAPFGPMVVWRVMSTFDCDEGCDMYDEVLEEGVTSIPVLFRKDPYKEIQDIVWDRNPPPFSPRTTQFRRRAYTV